jgi:hypothetical protein
MSTQSSQWFIMHIQQHTSDLTTFLSGFFMANSRFNITNNNIQKSIKQQPRSSTTHHEKEYPLTVLTLTHSEEVVQMLEYQKQGIHPRGARLFLSGHVNKNESQIQFCQYCWRGLHQHHQRDPTPLPFTTTSRAA